MGWETQYVAHVVVVHTALSKMPTGLDVFKSEE
jgi:hypothetical protein